MRQTGQEPCRRERGVALGLEPGLADDLRLGVGGRHRVALLDERRVALLHRVVVRHLAEVDLARLPETLLALLLLWTDLYRKSRCTYTAYYRSVSKLQVVSTCSLGHLSLSYRDRLKSMHQVA